ncbi:unnamed protein product, partial [Staurois parvus]
SLGPGWRFPACTRKMLRNNDGGETLTCCYVLLCTAVKYTVACLHTKTHTAHTVKHSTQLTL